MRSADEIDRLVERLKGLEATRGLAVGCGAGRMMLGAVVQSLEWVLGLRSDIEPLIRSIPNRGGDGSCLDPPGQRHHPGI